ncbi:uncharacterized protein J8A68_001800 [[Candida] subhashii]|uniref:Uncharacterized protein n=1 Tax=[Candida] subhashii TaxID=561895 RepID=A0A8J5QQP4_9ASCO|nr:uncharacterized protein J8A68_001800 [[Candida] subhashii]KAG7664703.1 hypothetical protein J8A68_001800 [[Candida] subhashii]
MSVSKETNKLINHSLNLTSKLIESDTNVSIIDLNMLENLNTNQSLNYIKLEQNLNQLELNSNHLKQLKSEFNNHLIELNYIEDKILIIEDLINEINKWSIDLQLQLQHHQQQQQQQSQH